MKKSFTYILFAFMAFMFVSIDASAEELTWIEVGTPSEFKAAIDGNHYANIRLTSDIDLSKISPESSKYLFDFTFSGRISGKGEFEGQEVNFSLTNSSYTLFEALTAAEFSDLFFMDSKFDGRDLSSGMIADDATGSTFTNIVFSKITAVGESGSYDCDRMGVVVGKATSNCSFKNITILNCELTIDGWALGLVAGEAEDCTFENCTTNAVCQLWADGNSDVAGINAHAYTGGICGYAKNCTLTKCQNFATVMSDDRCTGGIVGYATGTTMTDCRNGGVVKNCTKDGFGRLVREKVSRAAMIVSGVSGALSIASSLIYGHYFVTKMGTLDVQFKNMQFEYWHANMVKGFFAGGSYVPYSTAANIALIIATGGSLAITPVALAAISAASLTVAFALDIYSLIDVTNYLGGIAGTAESGCSITRCVNMGAVQCGHSYCGGIVGYLDDSTIESCYNRCIVKAQKDYVGGIVGYCKGSSSVKHCLNTASASSYTGEIGGIEGEYTSDCENKDNYFLSESYAEGATATRVPQEKLASGWVAQQLNSKLTTPIWRQDLGEDFYPTFLDTSKPIVTTTTDNYSIVQKINTGAEFALAVCNPLAQVSLEDDIDMDTCFFMLSTKAYPFKGVIKGNGHTISNAHYEASSTDNNAGGEQGHNAALFPWAENAIFENFTINNFRLTQRDETNKGYIKTQALLVGTSTNCKYNNITLRNSSILLNDDKDYKLEVGGMISNSSRDTLTNCTITSDCRFEGYTGNAVVNNTYVAGFAALANKSAFILCHNGATIWGDDNDEGGICGYCEESVFDRCLNSGHIIGQEKVAGIVGAAKNTVIKSCVNTGIIDDDESKDEDYHSGIVSELDGDDESKSYIGDCFNFGEIKYGSSNSAMICNTGTFTNAGNNYYHCNWKGTTYSYFDDKFTLEQLLSGEYVFGREKMYQSLDNDPFATNYPVPIPDAGTVYKNILCDGTVSYSNIFKSTAAHDSKDADGIGLCSICGKTYTAPSTINIDNAQDLCNLAYATNHGVDYSQSTIQLNQDIDMKDVSFTPIGLDTHPFIGTFNGNGHSIKNLTLKRTGNDGTGIFGCVSGSTTIRNLMVDGSCTIDGGSGKGAAGIVGAVTTPVNRTSVNLSLQSCANEAKVIGNNNVAGILGGVYSDDNTVIFISNSYNAGEIQGTNASAGIIGYGGKNITVRACFNTGSVTGTVANHPMINYASDATSQEFLHNYQYSELDADANAISVSAYKFANGCICDTLSQNSILWGQNIGTDEHPVFNRNGIYHKRAMARTWGTVVLPYAATSNSDIQFYTVQSCDVSSAEGKLNLTPVSSVAANTPCFFKKLKADADSICILQGSNAFVDYDGSSVYVVGSEDFDGWKLIGTYQDLDSVKNVYYLASDKIWYAEQPISFNAYRACMAYTGAAGNNSKSMAIFVIDDDVTTQVGEVTTDGRINFYDKPVYNIAGQRQNSIQRGQINIVGGKKFVIRN